MMPPVRDPAQRDAICKRARLLLELGRPADALAEVRRALAMNPNDPDALEIEGLCRLRLGEPLEALGPLGRAIAAQPEAAHAHYLYGFALREAGRLQEAADPLATALRLAPDEPVYLRALAELYADLRRYEEALPLARRATEVGPHRAANHVTFGYVASAAGRKEEARRAYETAVALDPNDAAAWNNLGCLDLEDRQPLRARLRFREALRLDPRGRRARRNLTLVAQPGTRPASWDDVVAGVARELARAGAPRTRLLALVFEAPAATAALVRGGTRGAALSGAALLVAARAMGPAGLVPLTAGALAAGTAWLIGRGRLDAERARVRAVLERGRAEFDQRWREWLDGGTPRDARDAALELLVEKLALQLIDPAPAE
jgi:tetratricopeptide (TPR) repeat protein